MGALCNVVMFDLDGTLIDSAPSILACFDQVFGDAGIKPLLPLNGSIIGPPLKETLALLAGTREPGAIDELAKAFKRIYDTDGYRRTVVYDGVGEVLSALHSRGVAMAVVTNKRKVPTIKILEHLGWQAYFSHVETSDSGAPPHPDKGAMIAALVAGMGLDRTRAVYVGDKREDGEAASFNDIAFLAAAWGYGDWSKEIICPGWEIVASPAGILESVKA